MSDSQLQSQASKPKNLVSHYTDVFKGLGLIKSDATIHIDKTIPPVIDPPGKIPYAIQVHAEIKRMLQLGVIVKQMEPTEWVNSITIVRKPSKIRICLDPTKLNRAIRRSPFPTTTIEEIIAKTSNAQHFLVLDAQTGYWQIKLDYQSSLLCTFNTTRGYHLKSRPWVIFSVRRCNA